MPSSVVFPVKWPDDGKTSPLASYNGREYPDPLASCPGYKAPSGLPIILQLGSGGVTPSVTAYSFSQNGVPLDSCEFDETNYTYPNSSSGQALGRTLLAASNAIVLIPRNSLAAGAVYTVSVTTNGRTYTWSFNVSSAPRVPATFLLHTN